MERPEPPSSKVRIAVRVRPAPPDSTGAECITCLDDGRTLNLNAGSGSSVRPRSFGFDTVLGGDTTQEEFFRGNLPRSTVDLDDVPTEATGEDSEPLMRDVRRKIA